MFEYLEKHWKKAIYITFSIYWALLLTATSLPGSDVPDLGVSDKIEHFTAYFIFSFMLCVVLMFQNRFQILKQKAFVSTLILVGLYAALDELHQLFIPGRACDILDWSTDIAAALIAVSMIYFLSKLNPLKREN